MINFFDDLESVALMLGLAVVYVSQRRTFSILESESAYMKISTGFLMIWLIFRSVIYTVTPHSPHNMPGIVAITGFPFITSLFVAFSVRLAWGLSPLTSFCIGYDSWLGSLLLLLALNFSICRQVHHFTAGLFQRLLSLHYLGLLPENWANSYESLSAVG